MRSEWAIFILAFPAIVSDIFKSPVSILYSYIHCDKMDFQLCSSVSSVLNFACISMSKIYCDNAAGTPVADEVADYMDKIQREIFGNPSSLHRFGQGALAVVEKSRRQVAITLGCSPGELYFTGSGSEANNLILRGSLKPGDHLITSAVEHASVYQTALELRKTGVAVSLLRPDSTGKISVEDVGAHIRPETKLISLMLVNNELGTLNSLKELAELAGEQNILLHSDAIQAYGKLPVDINNPKVDFLSISAHKIYGPKGTGAAFVRKGLKLEPFVYGGGQEGNLRAGTENVAGIGGFGVAAELICYGRKMLTNHLKQIMESFNKTLLDLKIAYHINGHSAIPGFVNITFPEISAETLMINLDLMGFAISAGSACSSGTLEPSRVLREIGMDSSEAEKTVRISFGKNNTVEDGIALARAIRKIIERITKQEVISNG